MSPDEAIQAAARAVAIGAVLALTSAAGVTMARVGENWRNGSSLLWLKKAGREMLITKLAIAAAAGAIAATAVLSPGSAGAAVPGTDVGAWSKDWKWFDANVGPMQIYRSYDSGFHFSTWQQTTAHLKHPNSPRDDYSFQLPPGAVASGTDDAQLTKFIASTPENIVLTDYHEPEQEIEAGLFTAQQFRDSIAHLSYLVHQQNLLDGGTRQVSVVLMYDTFTGFKSRSPNTYWPTAFGQGKEAPDLISADAYALPHATNTAGVPKGYTDGVKWQTGAQLLKPVLVFANSHNTHWGVSELGYLEDVHNPIRKANEIVATYNYAVAGKATPTTTAVNQAEFVEYWDSVGTRADWELRYNNPPVPSTSNTSNAAVAWKHLAGN